MNPNFQFSIDAFASDTPVGIIGGTEAGAHGHFQIEVWRKIDGELRFSHLLDFDNGITTAGLNSLLGVGFHDDTQIASWYVFPISNVSYSALSSADTMGSHGGWIESIAYTETTRPQWTCGTASGGAIVNSTQMVMTISADSTALVGMGVASSSTKNETSSILWATGLFGSVQNMNTGDVLKITYTVTLVATN
jgi:hypothetical protein